MNTAASQTTEPVPPPYRDDRMTPFQRADYYERMACEHGPRKVIELLLKIIDEISEYATPTR